MKIILADDHALVRDGVKHLLLHAEGEATILEAANSEELFSIAEKHPDVDLVLLDLVMPGIEGLSAISRLREMLPSTPIVILSFKEDYHTVRKALELGAKGFIPKSTSSEVLLPALKLIAAGGVYVPEALLQNPDPQRSGEFDATQVRTFKLTTRQREILELLVRGDTNKEIGRKLGLSEATVRTHITAIFKILNVSNRTQAGHVANKLGLVENAIENKG